MSERLYVIDTNVLISALLLPASTAQAALMKALRQGKVAQSLSTLDELKEVLERTKFDKYISREARIRFFTSLLSEAVTVEITTQITAARDPKDNKFLDLAVSGGAEILVSGDRDLLSLHPFQGISILSPAAFVSAE
jgi:putative PIN family toxin of toxin-antitoxin system